MAHSCRTYVHIAAQYLAQMDGEMAQAVNIGQPSHDQTSPAKEPSKLINMLDAASCRMWRELAQHGKSRRFLPSEVDSRSRELSPADKS